MAKPKLSYEAQRSADETAAFFGNVGKGVAPAIPMSGYGAATSGVGKNRRYDADAEEELARIAKKLDQAANVGPVKAGGQGAGGVGGDLDNKPKGDDPNKKEKPDGIKGDVDDDDGQVGAVGNSPMQIPLVGPAAVPGLGLLSKRLMDQFNKRKKDQEVDAKTKELYPDAGKPNRFDNL